MKTVVISVLAVSAVLGFFLLADSSETAPVSLLDDGSNDAVRSKLQISKAQQEKRTREVQGADMVRAESGNADSEKASSTDDVADNLEHAMRSGSVFVDLEPLYEAAYDTCNSELNALYGKTVTEDANTESLPTSECFRIKSLLIAALDKTVDFDEKLLLVEMLVRWERIDAQLDFIRSYAALPPIIDGVALADLERNSLYNSSSVNDKSSVIETFNALSHDAKIENSHEFFQTFVPLVLADASQGVVEYFPKLEATVESYPVPNIPEQNQKDELSQLAQKMPAFTNEEDFRLWAENNTDEFRNFLNVVESLDRDDRSAGALARAELSIGLKGQNLSPSVLSTFIANEFDDVNVYHVLREIRSLKDQGTYFTNYYREIQQNEMVRARAESLFKNPTFSDGQRSSVQKLYDEIWG